MGENILQLHLPHVKSRVAVCQMKCVCQAQNYRADIN